MDEQLQHEVIKKLVNEDGNRDRAAMNQGVTKRHINRLINRYKQNGKATFVHGNRGRKSATTDPGDTPVWMCWISTGRIYYKANFILFLELLECIEGINLSVSCVTNILEAEHILSPRVAKESSDDRDISRFHL